MNVGKRIKDRRLELNMSVDEVAAILGKNRATVYRYENGEIENLPITILEPIAEALETTPQYLMGWTDDSYDYDKDSEDRIASIPTAIFNALAKIYKNDPSKIWRAYWDMDADTLCESINARNHIPSSIIPYTQGRKIPIIGSIPAGVPVLAEENIEGYDYADVPETGEYFFLRVKGDSMINANIFDGSLVLVKSQPCAENGQIVVCLINGDEATLKRYYQQKDMVILKPENPDYQPIIVSCNEFENGYARILGIAVEVKIKL